MNRIRISIICALMAIVGVAATANAEAASRVVTIEYDCTGQTTGTVARDVQFYDADGHMYYHYNITCGGYVEEFWYGSTSPNRIGAIPPQTGPWVYLDDDSSPNLHTTYIRSAGGGALVGYITYDLDIAHHAELHLVGSGLGMLAEPDGLTRWIASR